MDWSALISDNGRDISVGRVLLWVCFFVTGWYWIYPFFHAGIVVSFPVSLENVIMFLLIYNLGKRVSDAYLASKIGTGQQCIPQKIFNYVDYKNRWGNVFDSQTPQASCTPQDARSIKTDLFDDL